MRRQTCQKAAKLFELMFYVLETQNQSDCGVFLGVVVVDCLLWHFSAAYELIVQSSLVLLHLLQNS